MKNIYCGICDTEQPKETFEEHLKTHGYACECPTCKAMPPGRFCPYTCGWCKGAPARELKKDDWRTHMFRDQEVLLALMDKAATNANLSESQALKLAHDAVQAIRKGSKEQSMNRTV